MELEDLVPEKERHPVYTKKFVAFSKGEEQTLRLFSFSHQHHTKLKKDERLIGAGNYRAGGYRGGTINWDSYSLIREVGYDRPSDPKEAEIVLAEIRQILDEWQKRVFPSSL
ncbi:hypothetical protein M0P48_01830 [Candidatus Gracilibacteria bacterium]|nr:hypothetical protein [Candidatus Gracilibacteria bacterium]